MRYPNDRLAPCCEYRERPPVTRRDKLAVVLVWSGLVLGIALLVWA